MAEMILTQYTGTFIGPVAKLLGYIMNGIYMFMNSVFHIQNIGLCIIIFTIIMYLILLPLTIKQQKFSKLSAKMQPEIQEIQKKYKGKKDQASMMAMNEETQLVYQKYGISPSGSCIQLLIQLPILLALYRVIYNIPAYVGGIKEYFNPVVEGIMGVQGYQSKMTDFLEAINLRTVSLNFEGTDIQAANSIVDVLYKMPVSAWDTLKDSFSGLTGVIDTLEVQLAHLNSFLGINIANAPMELIRSGWSAGQYLLVFGAIMVPVLSAVTQLLNIKLMPTPAAATDNGSDTMANSMKTMNYMMPVFSFIMVFSVPVGIGIYWIAGALIRSIQQVVINRYVEKIDLDDLIKKNQEKAKKKREKKGIPENQISSAARMNTRKLSEKATVSTVNKEDTAKNVSEQVRSAKPGSLAAKANLVKEFNERNNK